VRQAQRCARGQGNGRPANRAASKDGGQEERPREHEGFLDDDSGEDSEVGSEGIDLSHVDQGWRAGW
jgi:hypothetical protein